MTYLQGYRSRSWIEYSLLKKCVGFTMKLTMRKISNFPPSQILPVPLCQCHLHILARKYLLATCPRPRQFASKNSREIGRGVATGIGTVSAPSFATHFLGLCRLSQAFLPFLRHPARVWHHASSVTQPRSHHSQCDYAAVCHPYTSRCVHLLCSRRCAN